MNDTVLWVIIRNQIAIMAAQHATLEVLGASAEDRKRLLVRIEEAVAWLEQAAEESD